MSNVFKIDQFGKKEKQVRCPHCASGVVIRYGTYPRNHPEKEFVIAVQRYFCKSPLCPWKTFSILPYPLLPFIRHLYKTLFLCHYLFIERKETQATIARLLGKKRGVVKRLGQFCRQFILWFNHEKEFADWGPDPEQNGAALWPDFTRDFSQVFYPGRWWIKPPT